MLPEELMSSSDTVSTKDRTVALTSQREGSTTTVRLERLVPGRHLEEELVQHWSRDGVFSNVVVMRKTSMDAVAKPHVMTSFHAYVINASGGGKFLEKPRKKERRDMKFWFYRGLDSDQKLLTCSQFVRLLIEPETFPTDMLGFIKKNLLLMKHFVLIKRLQLEIVEEEDEEEDKEEEKIPLIENFITVLTPAVYDYQYLPEVPVSKKSMISFRLRAGADGHVALSYVYGDTDRRTYEVVLGGWGNKRSAIRYGGRGEIQVEKPTPNILDKKEFKEFWISWSGERVRVGRGLEEGQDCFLEWKDIPAKKLHSVNLVSVSTGPGSDGRWEFVEYIVPYDVRKETKGQKRYKVLRGLVWYAKKEKIIRMLEEAFPSYLNMPDLLRLSTVSLGNMLEAVVFLKKAQKDGNLLETSKGVWMRWHCHHADSNHELRRVLQVPRFSNHDAPTVAIVTSTYLEKVAVDVMFDRKVSYLVEGNSRQVESNNQLYTVGFMSNKHVVAMKLGHFNPEVGSLERHAQSVAALLSRFERVRHVMIVGVGGAVPDHTNFERHCRRGDVVISGPRPSDGAMYVCSHGVDDEPEVDPTGSSAFFPTSCWNSDGAGDYLQKQARSLVDQSTSASAYRSSNQSRSWEKHISEALEVLGKSDERFHRPAEKTDKLTIQVDRRQGPLPTTHPLPPLDRRHLRRDNQPLLKRGAIASGKSVARDLIYRRIFAGRNQILAYDCGLDKVVEAAMNRVGVDNTAVVLGMTDYSDGSLGKSWQPYAGLVAAACVKSLVGLV